MNGMQDEQLYTESDPDEQMNAFYAELDPEKRIKLMEKMSGMRQEEKNEKNGSMPEQDLEFCRELLQKRYHRQGRLNYADNGILSCVMLLDLERDNLRGKKAAAKLEEAIGLLIPSSVRGSALFTPLQKRAFYREVRNIIHRYLTTCMDQSYHKKFFGFIRLSDAERFRHMFDDIWNISYGSVLRSDHFMREVTAEYMRIWCRAAEDEFDSISSEAADAMAARKRERGLN